mmetsp:Transcript_24556/g.63775  ORF Transcript_24556/g.63775 Transcript_24556/m.63775 type:complete len:507 (-) Transcript_24556:158-1678(-)
MSCLFSCFRSQEGVGESPEKLPHQQPAGVPENVTPLEHRDIFLSRALPDGAPPVPPLRLPPSAGAGASASGLGDGAFTARLDIDDDDVASTCWLSEYNPMAEAPRHKQVLWRAGQQQQAVERFSTVDLPGDAPPLLTKLAALPGDKNVRIESDSSWPNAGSRASHTSGIAQPPTKQYGAFSVSGSQQLIRRAPPTKKGVWKETAAEDASREARSTGHQKTPSDVPEHLTDMMLDHERRMPRTGAAMVTTSSTASGSSTATEHKLEPRMCASSQAAHPLAPYALETGRSLDSSYFTGGGGSTSRSTIASARSNIPRKAALYSDIPDTYRRLTACRESRTASTGSCKSGPGFSGGAIGNADADEVSSSVKTCSANGQHKRGYAFIPRKAAPFSHIPDTERRIEAARLAAHKRPAGAGLARAESMPAVLPAEAAANKSEPPALRGASPGRRPGRSAVYGNTILDTPSPAPPATRPPAASSPAPLWRPAAHGTLNQSLAQRVAMAIAPPG